MLLIDPDKQEWQFGLTLGFPATHNAAEYEALIAGLELARALGVRKSLVYTDSQLVASKWGRSRSLFWQSTTRLLWTSFSVLSTHL